MIHSRLASKQKELISFVVLFMTITVCCLVLYSNFIFGQDVFVFAGVGADSIGQTIPFLLNETERLKIGDISLWNQYQFLGALTIQFLNLEYIPSLFGRDAIPLMMLVMQIIKIYLAGIFFYLFLGYHNLKFRTRIISAVGLAFCGRMIELAPWTAYTMEIPLAAGMLWGFERFLSDNKRVVILPLMIACIGLTQGLYATVLYTLVLVMYSVFRIGYLWDVQWNARRAMLTALKLAALLCLGYAIASPILYPSIKMYATSARVSSDFSGPFSIAHLFAPTDPSIFAEEVIKLFSNGILGHMSSYRGFSTILNAPYYFCGLIATITFPLAFKDKSRRQRGFLLFIAAAAFFYMYSEGFRYLVNGFSVPGADFRQSSFWVVLVIALFGAYGLDRAWSIDSSSKRWLIISGTLACTLFAAACLILRQHVSVYYFILTLGFLIIYITLLLASAVSRRRTKQIVLLGILLFVPIEIISQNIMPIRKTTYVTVDQYSKHFSNNPSQIVQSLSSETKNTYRIDYKAVDLTNPMGNAYMGTQAYIGGAGITQEVNEFLKNTGNSNVRDLGYTRYIYGYNDIATNSLLGAKYLVALNGGIPVALPFGYRMIEENNQYSVAENIYSLPLVYGYSESDIQKQDTFYSLPYRYRIASLVNKAVVSEPGKQQKNKANSTAEKTTSTSIEGNSATIDSGCKLDFPQTDMPYVQINMSLHDQATASGMLVIYIDFYNQEGSLAARYPYITANGEEEISIPIHNQNYSACEISIANVNACVQPYLDKISYSFTSDSDYAPFINAQSNRVANQTKVISYNGNKLVSNIQMNEAGYIATSIPWDASWKMYIDGVQVDTKIINLGFIGAKIDEGKHEVVLVYDDAPLYICLGISALTLLGIIYFEFSQREKTSGL